MTLKSDIDKLEEAVREATEADDYEPIPDNLAELIIAARGGNASALAADSVKYADSRSLAARIAEASTHVAFAGKPEAERKALLDQRDRERTAAAQAVRSERYGAPVTVEEVELPQTITAPAAISPQAVDEFPGQAPAAINRPSSEVPNEREAIRLLEAEERARAAGRKDHNPLDHYRADTG